MRVTTTRAIYEQHAPCPRGTLSHVWPRRLISILRSYTEIVLTSQHTRKGLGVSYQPLGTRRGTRAPWQAP
jgi:hypothetical protein